MPAGLIRVTPEQLQSASSQFAGGARNIEATLGTLNREVNTLIGSWAGTGSTQFQGAYTQWQAAQKNLHQALETIARLTGNAAVSYTDNDAGVGATFR